MRMKGPCCSKGWQWPLAKGLGTDATDGALDRCHPLETGTYAKQTQAPAGSPRAKGTARQHRQGWKSQDGAGQ